MFELAKIGKHQLLVRLEGAWARVPTSGKGKEKTQKNSEQAGLDLLAQLKGIVKGGEIKSLGFETTNLGAWDSQIVILILRIEKAIGGTPVGIDFSGLPPGLRGLIALSKATPPRAGDEKLKTKLDFFEFIGTETLTFIGSLKDLYRFVGKSLHSLGRLFKGKAHFQRSDILVYIQAAGPQALPIVSIVNILLGVILAFMGATQLRQFGAQIFVADLVAVGQTRDIAPMMTAIVLAGRTGAAYAAQLGTMQVNEEIDALKTFGFVPMDFLVLPRMLALAIMMPFLVLFGDVMGIFGGFIIGVGLLDIGSLEYFEQTKKAIDLTDIMVGLFKGGVFGILVAITGCMYGMKSGRNAAAVGDAATSAVVSGILAIILTTALINVLLNVMGI